MNGIHNTIDGHYEDNRIPWLVITMKENPPGRQAVSQFVALKRSTGERRIYFDELSCDCFISIYPQYDKVTMFEMLDCQNELMGIKA